MKLRPPNPIALLFGPIFQKEVRVLGRRRGTYAARCAFSLGLLGLVTFFFLTFLAESPGGIERLQSLQTLAPILTLVIVWFQFVVLAMMAPMLTSDGISEEGRARTLSALLTTPLSASHIVFGKLSSRLVQIVVLSLLALPILLSIRVFGGLSAQVLLAATAIILSTALLGASLGLMFSLWNRRSSTAAMHGMLVLGLVQFGPLIAEGLRVHLLRTWAIPHSSFDGIIVTASPLILGDLSQAAIIGMSPREIVTTFSSGGRSIYLGPAWVLNTFYNLGLTLLFATATSAILRRSMQKLANETPVALRRRGLFGWRAARSSPAAAAGSADGNAAPQQVASDEPSSELQRGSSRTIQGNPVLWREIRQQTMGSRRRLVLALVAVVIAAGLLYWRVSIFEEPLHVMIAVIGSMAALAQAAYATSGSISGEREGRTWEALLATPLTGPQIILAKFAGAVRGLWFTPAVMLAHFIIAAVFDAVAPLTPALLILVLAGPMILLAATGQFFALALRRNTVAAAVNLILAFAIFAGPWVGLAGIAGLLRGSQPLWFQRLADVLYAAHPLTLAVSLTIDPPGRARGSYDLMYGSMEADMFALLIVGVFAGYLLLSAGALGLTCRFFRLFTGRPS